MATAGDLDADGYADFAVGETQYAGYDGRVLIVHGRSSGLASVARDQQLTSHERPRWPIGSCVASAGDVNGDGLGDLSSALRTKTLLPAFSGQAYLISAPRAARSCSRLLAREGNQADARAGSTVAGIGDVNHDGYADLAVARRTTTTARRRTRDVTVYLGSDGEVTSFAELDAARHAGGRASRFGLCGAGDVNGDGYDDLAVGSPGWDGDGPVKDASRCSNGPSGLATTAARTLDGNVGQRGLRRRARERRRRTATAGTTS